MKRWEHPERSKSGLRGGIGRGHSEQPQAVLEQGKEGSGLWRQDEAVEERLGNPLQACCLRGCVRP